MDRAAVAVRLPPVARLACALVCALAVAVLSADAAAGTLAPPPWRLALVSGHAVWAPAGTSRLGPPPGRWEADWAAGGPLSPAVSPRSLRGRA